MDRCSTSHIIKEMIVRYHYTHIRMAKIWNTDNTKRWQGCGATGTLIHGWWGCKVGQLLCKTVWRFLTKLNIHLLYNIAIMLLGIYSINMLPHRQNGSCARQHCLQ